MNVEIASGRSWCKSRARDSGGLRVDGDEHVSGVYRITVTEGNKWWIWDVMELDAERSKPCAKAILLESFIFLCFGYFIAIKQIIRKSKKIIIRKIFFSALTQDAEPEGLELLHLCLSQGIWCALPTNTYGSPAISGGHIKKVKIPSQKV